MIGAQPWSALLQLAVDSMATAMIRSPSPPAPSDGLFGRPQARGDRSGSLSGKEYRSCWGEQDPVALVLACAVTAANALTQEELLSEARSRRLLLTHTEIIACR